MEEEDDNGGGGELYGGGGGGLARLADVLLMQQALAIDPLLQSMVDSTFRMSTGASAAQVAVGRWEGPIVSLDGLVQGRCCGVPLC